MIVKNESAIIEECLESVRGIIDYWVIVDTGSTDGTQDKVQKCLRHLPGELHERKWKNFAHNRNEALELAKNRGDYLLFMDADQKLVLQPDFTTESLTHDFYLVPIEEPGKLYSCYVAFIATRLDWFWEGSVHEMLRCPLAKTHEVLAGVTNFSDTRKGARSRDPEKYLKDAQVLEEDLQKDPNNSRTVFYLMACYCNAKNYPLALKYCRQRVLMGGVEEERFLAQHATGQLEELLGESPNVFLASYLAAWKMRKKRAEPLFCMANYYLRKKDYFHAYLLTKSALQIPMPQEVYFLDRSIYDHKLLLQFAECAYGLGKLREARSAWKQLLAKDLPVEICDNIKRNLSIIDRKI